MIYSFDYGSIHRHQGSWFYVGIERLPGDGKRRAWYYVHLGWFYIGPFGR